VRRLEGEVAVVTGAGRGIGRAIAGALAAEGAAVAIAELDTQTAGEAAEECAGFGVCAVALPTNVSDADQVEALFVDCARELGEATILVNNAGIGVPGPLLDYREEQWQRQLDVNLKGVFLCLQAAARRMVPRRAGRIVSIASTAAFVSSSQLAEVAYDVSKAGVRQLTISAAYELAPHGITVNAVAPGQILTDLTRKGMSDPERYSRAVAKIPLGRLGTPEDVAAAVVFLASSDASYITGHTLVVDGGWLTH
jgi:NAD(P)-dependent dehydrogenase (short-subunit alcohol dehydrogenase family)